MNILKFVDATKNGIYSEVPRSRKCSLKDMFIESLGSMNWSERELENLLLKMKTVADNETLYKTIEGFIKLSCNKLDRVEQIFTLLKHQSTLKRNAAVEGLIKEAENKTAIYLDGTVCDMTILMVLQLISQYKITHYNILEALAKTLNSDIINNILTDIIQDEKEANMLVTKMVNTIINSEFE